MFIVKTNENIFMQIEKQIEKPSKQTLKQFSNKGSSKGSGQSSNQLAKRTLSLLLILFSVCSLKLCAEDSSPAQAQVKREKFVAEAKKYVGTPYQLGAVGPDKFDCSGLVYFVAREAIGVQLPRTSKALYSYCKIVPDSKKEVGDLLFFKTNSSAAVTHVGIYIGNNQFISAISDGPNVGVIISSLNQPYWKPKYVACGQFLKPGTGGDTGSAGGASGENFDDGDTGGQVATSGKRTGDGKAENSNSNPAEKKVSSFKGSSFYKPDASVLDALTMDAALFVGWSLISPNEFMLKWRGVDFQSNVRFSKWFLEPGLGFSLKYNHGLGLFQLPILLSATVNDYLRFYAGPVFSFGDATMVNSDKKISPSVFPGILGISLSTPSFNVSKAKVQVVQDISYTVFNKVDNSALSFVESLSAGLVLFTGVRVTLGMGSLLGK